MTKFYFILIILLKVMEIYGNDLAANTCYDPSEDNGALIVEMLFKKLNRILHENTDLKTQLADLNKRFNEEDEFLKAEINKCALKIQNVNEKQQQLNNSLVQFSTTVKDSIPWTVIQRRQDGSLNFDRDWIDYKMGFGLPSGEFFIGLEQLHEITTKGAPQQLLITLQDLNDNTRYAKYDEFQIDSETEKYALKKIENYSGNAGDSLSQHKGMKFTTRDQDNDTNSESNCAKLSSGGWWFLDCLDSNLNGKYTKDPKNNGSIIWTAWHGKDYSYKFVEMKIRPAP